jgi:hypothetical protein
MVSKSFYERVFRHSAEKNAIDDCHKELMQAITQFQVITLLMALAQCLSL